MPLWPHRRCVDAPPLDLWFFHICWDLQLSSVWFIAAQRDVFWCLLSSSNSVCSIMIEFRMLSQKWLLIFCGLSQQMVGACVLVSYCVSDQIPSPLSRICMLFHIPVILLIDMGLCGLERAVNACCRCCKELMVHDPISCWRWIHSPNYRPA